MWLGQREKLIGKEHEGIFWGYRNSQYLGVYIDIKC